MDERDGASYGPHRDSYYDEDADYPDRTGYVDRSQYVDRTGFVDRAGLPPRGGRGGFPQPPAGFPQRPAGRIPADRGGSGPHFYDPRRLGPRLPDIDEDYDDEPGPNWRRRLALVALGGGAATLIGGGAYAVTQFLGQGTAREENAAATEPVSNEAPPSYVDQNESLMNGEAGIGVRKNTPATGKLFGSPSDASRNAKPKGNTVLPKNAPVRHLASRLTFGPTPDVIADINKLGIDSWIAKQLKPETIPLTRGEQKLDAELTTYGMTYEQLRTQREALGKKGINADNENVKYAIGKQIWSDRQLFEMMVDVWNDHLHVAAYHDGNELVRAAFDRDVIRKHALGNYVDMFLAANRHPALLRYLDQEKSTKNNINENLARENLELYTVGANNGYSETDIRQAAMLQTGRGIRDGQYVYRADQHYVGPVKIMGFTHANGTAEGGEAAQDAYFRYLALHPNAAKYISQQIATRFVSDTPPATLVSRMAKTYLDTKSNIPAVLMTMLRSTEFWESVGQKFRRSGEYLTATYRALGVQPDAPAGFTTKETNISPFSQGLGDLHRKLDELGHAPMTLPTPNGFPDVYVAWVSAGTMLAQWNDAQVAVEGGRKMFTWNTPENLLGANPPATAGAYLDALTKRLINVTLTANQKAPLLAIAGVKADTPVDKTFNGAIAAVVRTIFATPHHHLR